MPRPTALDEITRLQDTEVSTMALGSAITKQIQKLQVDALAFTERELSKAASLKERGETGAYLAAKYTELWMGADYAWTDEERRSSQHLSQMRQAK